MSRIKVAFNGRFLGSRHPTGTHRSAMMFLRALAKHQDELEISLHAPRARLAFADPEQFGVPVQIVKAETPVSWHIWEQTVWPREALGLGINPINTGPFLPGSPRQIIFAHDLNILRFPDNYSWRFKTWYRLASVRAIRRARHVVCFTEYVKRDLTKFLSLSPTAITVLPQGPGLPVDTRNTPCLKRDKFFLCVGGMQPHKNLKGCLQAWRLAGLATRGYKLKIAGKPQANYTPLGIANDLLAQPGVEFTGYLDDASLMELYRGCAGFIYPSFEEGFGLPLVEAFYLGAPVVTSDQSCLPEIAGDAALLVPPGNPGEIADAMKRLVDEPDLCHRLQSAGRRRAAVFSWDEAGLRLCQLLKGIANSETTRKT